MLFTIFELKFIDINIYIYIFLNYLKKCYFLLTYYIKPVNDPFSYVKGLNLNDRSHNTIFIQTQTFIYMIVSVFQSIDN